MIAPASEGYFLYHSIGTFPDKEEALRDELGRFAALWSRADDGQWPAALALRQEFIERWSALIGAPPGTLTTAENVTAGLYSVIGSLPDGVLRGQRVLVAADCFPSLHFLLAGLAGRFGFTLDTVPLRPNETWVRDEDFLARWRPDVGLALLTWVTSTASSRCNVAALAAHGQRMGSVVGVDITQGAGIIPFSATLAGVGFVLSTSLKWVCGTPGAGIICISPALLADCRPEFRGWFSQQDPFSWELDAFRFADDSRRFDHGTPAVLPAVGCLPGLRWLAAAGIDSQRAHNLLLSERIIAQAGDRGWSVVSPVDAARRGGSVMIRLPPPLQAAAVVAALRARRLYCDARGTVLRLSPGAVTSADAVDHLFDALGTAT